MIYDDGYAMDGNLKVIRCPQCNNEEFIEKGSYCRICGGPVFNLCEGEEHFDDFGHSMGFTYHRNAGNARYCELCGKPTQFLKIGYLQKYTDIDISDDLPY